MSDHTGKTDAQLAELDVEQLLRSGLGGPVAEHRTLFGEGAVAGAIRLGRLDVVPRSVSFLAEVVRRGGTGHAAELPEPLPTPEQAAVVKPWLAAAAEGAAAAGDGDEQAARWLEAVAAVLALRAASGTA